MAEQSAAWRERLRLCGWGCWFPGNPCRPDDRAACCSACEYMGCWFERHNEGAGDGDGS